LDVLSINEIEEALMPRAYTLGKRGEAQAETRRRILEATLRLYREVGVAATTVASVAQAADVAPATVRNHFPNPTALAEAAADAILADVGVPDERIFEGATGPIERVERLVRELAAFFERSTGWWQVREADRGGLDAWALPEARYNAHMERLIRIAVAPLDDPVVLAVIGAVLVHVYFAGRINGLEPAAAGEIELQLLVPWLEGLLAARRP
jgi:AcrR family transcriptional regulator